MKRRSRYVPCHFVTNRENIPLGMKVLSHTNITQTDNRHNTHIQRQHWFILLVPRHHRNTEAPGSDCMCFKTLRFRSLWLWSWTLLLGRGCGRKLNRCRVHPIGTCGEVVVRVVRHGILRTIRGSWGARRWRWRIVHGIWN